MYYLKYRPKSFAELFGAKEISKALQNSLEKGQAGHAYIFTGPKGSGKTTTARILAKALNCESLAYGTSNVQRSTSDVAQMEPCNKCDNCLAINEGRFLDLLEIDAASNRGIDDIRSLRDKIKLSPSLGRFKVYIIDEVHMLTTEAFNALLKTLEEPPRHAVFVLATTEFAKIPETIKSRCQVLHFRRAKKEEVVAKLEFICKREGVEVGREKLLKIAELAEGGFRNAETLLEQVIVGELSLENITLSASHFVDLIILKERKEAFEYLESIVEAGEGVVFFTKSLLNHLRNLLLVLGGVTEEVLDCGNDSFEDLKRQAESLGPTNLKLILKRFLEAEEGIKFSPIPELPLEMAVFDVTETALGGGKTGTKKVEASVKILEKASSLEERLPPSKVVSQNPETSKPDAKAPGSIFSLSLVSEKWDEILKAIRPFNHSLEALLRSARPKEILPDGKLVIEVFYKFHKDKLSDSSNIDVLQKVLRNVLGITPKIAYVLGEKKSDQPSLQDSGGPNGDSLVEAALEVFGA